MLLEEAMRGLTEEKAQYLYPSVLRILRMAVVLMVVSLAVLCTAAEQRAIKSRVTPAIQSWRRG